MAEQPALQVDVQHGDSVAMPPGCAIAEWAGVAFEMASASGWDSPWRERCTQAEEIIQVELAARVVDAAEGAQLNATYRGKDYATNVLSFPADIVVDGCALLGDLVLCAPVVEREAREQNKALTHHYAHLTVHGLLHLLGHDHEQENEAEAMEAKEIAVLGAIGVADPYAG